MKYAFTIVLFVTATFHILAQPEDYAGALQTDGTWFTEYFKFPIGFAQDIDYEGMEDARFPPGWRKIETDEFWSYVFAWDINLNTKISAKEIERDLQIYFNGLMGLDGENNKGNSNIKKSVARFTTIESQDNTSQFQGTVQTFDAFTSQKEMILNVTAVQYLCSNKNKSLIIFRFSPKPLDHKIWTKLNLVKMRADLCSK